MITFLIVLLSMALAWSVIGFALAILLLKWRWNLVGGFLLVTFSWFPLLVMTGILSYAAWNGTLPACWFDLKEIYLIGPRSLEMFAGGGFITGMIVATIVGLWPRRSDEGKRERRARTMPVIRIFVIGAVAIGLSWGLFYGADWRASSKLRQLREVYASKLEEQNPLSSGQLGKTAAAQEMFLLALLQDDDPAWTVGSGEFARMQKIRPSHSSIDDLQLLQIFVPTSGKIDEIRPVVNRYEEQLQTLRTEVFASDDEPQYWHPLLARLVTYDALVHLYDDDLDRVLADLKLLRSMGRQLLTEGVDAPSAYQWIEFYRVLIFQAVLGRHSPGPEAIYEEMLQEIPGLRPCIYRNVKREMKVSILDWIDHLLTQPAEGDARREQYLIASIERMVWSDRLPSTIEEMEQEIDAYYMDETLRYTPFGTASFPGFWYDYEWFGGGPFIEELVYDTNQSSAHFVRYEMFRAAREIELFQAEHGRYPTSNEFQQMLIDTEFPIPLTLVPLSDRQSRQIVGVMLMQNRHANLKDQLGIYLGDSFFRLIDHLENYEITAKDGKGAAVWSFDPSVKKLLNPTLPDYGDSRASDQDDAMN